MPVTTFGLNTFSCLMKDYLSFFVENVSQFLDLSVIVDCSIGV